MAALSARGPVAPLCEWPETCGFSEGQIVKRVALMSQTSPAPCCMFRHHQRGTLGGLAMKKFLLGSVGLAAMLAGPAMAADMRLPPPPPPVVYYDWSGAYIGFNAGGVWNETNRTFLVGGAGQSQFLDKRQ